MEACSLSHRRINTGAISWCCYPGAVQHIANPRDVKLLGHPNRPNKQTG